MKIWQIYILFQVSLSTYISNTEAELVGCLNADLVENGDVVVSLNKTTFNISCDNGFEITSNGDLTCFDNRERNYTLCELGGVAECFNYSVKNGNVSSLENKTYYITGLLPVFCRDGYDLDGDAYIKCLDNGTWTTNSLCVSADNRTTESTKKEDTELILLIVGLILVLAIITCVVVLLTLRQFRRKHARDNIEKADLTTDEMEIQVFGKFRKEAVPVSEFPAYVDELHKRNNIKFSDAFRLITELSPKHSTSVAESAACRPKTRFSNILPFDHSRVILTKRDDVAGSDFINANFIPGFNALDEFIATQGPVSETKNDFWRMTWEHDVQIIVMLTERIEKGKGSLPRNCSLERHWLAQTFEPYWPDMVEGQVLYGDLVINTASETVMSDYITRKMEIKKGDETKYVTHLQFVSWPDRRKLKKTWPFLTFVTTVRHLQTYSTGKHTVVHCSNGVGRTGIFIAVDRLLQQQREERFVDVCSVVLDMRNYRCNMVKTEEQFIYIFECLRHYITLESDAEDGEEGEQSQYVSIEDGLATFDNVAFFKEEGESQ